MKKTFALFLLMVGCFVLFSVTAMAAPASVSTEAELRTAVTSGDTPITVTANIPVNGSLDGNGTLELILLADLYLGSGTLSGFDISTGPGKVVPDTNSNNVRIEDNIFHVTLGAQSLYAIETYYGGPVNGLVISGNTFIADSTSPGRSAIFINPGADGTVISDNIFQGDYDFGPLGIGSSNVTLTGNDFTDMNTVSGKAILEFFDTSNVTGNTFQDILQDNTFGDNTKFDTTLCTSLPASTYWRVHLEREDRLNRTEVSDLMYPDNGAITDPYASLTAGDVHQIGNAYYLFVGWYDDTLTTPVSFPSVITQAEHLVAVFDGPFYPPAVKPPQFTRKETIAGRDFDVTITNSSQVITANAPSQIVDIAFSGYSSALIDVVPIPPGTPITTGSVSTTVQTLGYGSSNVIVTVTWGPTGNPPSPFNALPTSYNGSEFTTTYIISVRILEPTYETTEPGAWYGTSSDGISVGSSGAFTVGEYQFIDSTGRTIVDFGNFAGSGDLTGTVNGPFNRFVRVKMDGAVVNANNYTVREGSTIITFKEAYLKTLSSGTHSVQVEYTDGSAFGTLTVGSASTYYNPNTGSVLYILFTPKIVK